MTNETNATDSGVTWLLVISVSLLLFSLSVQFITGFQTSVIFNEMSYWLKTIPAAQSWVGKLNTYGVYAVVGIELMTLCFLVVPVLRRIGSGVGVLLASITLLVYLLVSVNSMAWVSDVGVLVAGGSVVLLVVFSIACGLLFLSSNVAETEPLDERSQAMNVELEKELADEAMESVPITDYSELSEQIPFHTSVTNDIEESFKQLLMDVTRGLRDDIEGNHHSVYVEALGRIDNLSAQHKYFPRQPMIIPKLIRAINSESSTKKRLVDVISQDPVIAGELLRVANSPYYRLSDASIDSIGRAILVLGVDGLRFLTSTLVLQPVAQTDKTYFPGFTNRVWLQSVLAANAAQAYARKTRSCDSFTAHLMGLLSSIGHIVIFQMLLDVYKNHPAERPKIEVLGKLQRNYADEVSASVIESWQLADEFVETLKAYQLQGDVNDLSPLGRALYYGRMCGSLFMLHESGRYSEEQVRDAVAEQGLHIDVFEAMWEVLNEGESSLSEVWG